MTMQMSSQARSRKKPSNKEFGRVVKRSRSELRGKNYAWRWDGNWVSFLPRAYHDRISRLVYFLPFLKSIHDFMFLPEHSVLQKTFSLRRICVEEKIMPMSSVRPRR